MDGWIARHLKKLSWKELVYSDTTIQVKLGRSNRKSALLH